MLFHLPIIILASLQPVPGADTVPKFDVSRVCQSEGGSNEEEKRCMADEAASYCASSELNSWSSPCSVETLV
jgi:hypothetical protein